MFGSTPRRLGIETNIKNNITRHKINYSNNHFKLNINQIVPKLNSINIALNAYINAMHILMHILIIKGCKNIQTYNIL